MAAICKVTVNIRKFSLARPADLALPVLACYRHGAGAAVAIRYRNDDPGRAGAAFPYSSPAGPAAAAAEPVGPRLGPAACLDGFRGSRDHEFRLRGHAWPQ